ncbi:sensor domain-containing diguanylate cyclase [Paenibacillus sp. BC26]|uniref:sensor domain-containing diguanylate cyclase n=1 Tax=Paenibacillus sp. BC26 TaxID=1881032 RepID=UPI0008E8E139|nr:diguanylate cyclase [Paenibacillus sp. BC26]SFS61138.1 diguanylate cyclase (GGDEF) domain-containing protein [Paenibacillus sp. BC26]
MKSIDSDWMNNTNYKADIRLNTQQPTSSFPSGDIHESSDSTVISLLKESFQNWLEEAKAMKSPLLDYELALYSAAGQVIAQHGQEVNETQSVRLEVSLLNRSIEPQSIATLVLVKRDKSDELHSLLHTTALLIRQMFYHRFDVRVVRDLHNRQKLSEKEARHQDTMFNVAKRLHDQNDVSMVLQVLLQDMAELYPLADVNLYLSQDHVNNDPRVKPLMLRHSTEDIYARSFLSGQPIVSSEENSTRVAIPMSGKQAVYGVLSLVMQTAHWEDAEIRALAMLADTAGSAFENAKLFEQSNLLISELQLINELAKRLNQSLRLNEVFDYAMTELLHIFKADYCHLIQLTNEQQSFQIAASNLPSVVGEKCPTAYGFCGIIHSTKEPLIISDYLATRVVESKLMDETGSRSLIAAPVMSGSELFGVIMVSDKSANYFSYENYKLLQVLTTHIGLAISNASLHAEVRRMVITDNLTGLYARNYLNEQIQYRQRKDPCGSLVLVDIDHFKKVNDTYGHLIGDSILVIVSEMIRSCIRDSDIAARWGGEELAVYLPQIRSMQAYRIAERIRNMVEEHTEPKVTVSCGLSEWTFEEEKISVESLFYRADMALYEAKKNGRNRIMIG